MDTLYKYAEQELKYLSDYDPDPNNRPILEEFIPEIMELIKKFSKNDYPSSFNDQVAKTISDGIYKLLSFKPLMPLQDWPDEWIEINTNPSYFQNKRLSSLFKEKKDGDAYYLDAILWKTEDGNTWIGSAKTSSGEIIGSRQYINFPFEPKTFIIDVEKNNFDFIIKDESQLNEVFNYYIKFEMEKDSNITKEMMSE